MISQLIPMIPEGSNGQKKKSNTHLCWLDIDIALIKCERANKQISAPHAYQLHIFEIYVANCEAALTVTTAAAAASTSTAIMVIASQTQRFHNGFYA